MGFRKSLVFRTFKIPWDQWINFKFYPEPLLTIFWDFCAGPTEKNFKAESDKLSGGIGSTRSRVIFGQSRPEEIFRPNPARHPIPNIQDTAQICKLFFSKAIFVQLSIFYNFILTRSVSDKGALRVAGLEGKRRHGIIGHWWNRFYKTSY